MPRGYLKRFQGISKKVARGGGSRRKEKGEGQKKRRSRRGTKVANENLVFCREVLKENDVKRDDVLDRGEDVTPKEKAEHYTPVLGVCAVCQKVGSLVVLMKNCDHPAACLDCLRGIYVTQAQASVDNYPLRCFCGTCKLLVRDTQLQKHGLVRSDAEMARHYHLTAEAKLNKKLGKLGVTVCGGDPAAYQRILGPLRMDFVDALEGHSFARRSPAETLRMDKLYKELRSFDVNLPADPSSTIFVRVLESRFDLIRVLITGPEGTPYENGCFFFDVYLRDYPRQAPEVNFLTTGGGRVRFNPNLYNCGKVCLSLLGTWSGPGWQPDKSTLLQVLVSIQGLVLVSDPYFNEPGYAGTQNDSVHKKRSEDYSSNIRRYTIEHAMLNVLTSACKENPTYAEFADVVIQHFSNKAAAIEAQLESWIAQDSSITMMADQVLDRLHGLCGSRKRPKKKLRRTERRSKRSPRPRA